MARAQFQEGLINGTNEYFFENGNIKKQFNLNKNGYHGVVKEYVENGRLISNENYVDGKRVYQSRNNSVNCQSISDNPNKYIGKTVTMRLGYASSLNDSRSLQSGEYRSQEMAFSSYLGIYDGDERYYTRVGDCSGGPNYYLRIPFSIGRQVPNMRSGYINVSGVLKNRKTIIVKSISR